MSAKAFTYLASAAFWLLLIGVALGMRAGTAHAGSGGTLPGSGGSLPGSTGVLPGSTGGSLPGSVEVQPLDPTDSTDSSIVAGVPLATPVPCILPFDDVQETDYYYEPVKYLYCHGSISGYGDGTFKPGENLTRGQICKIVVLALDLPFYVPQKPSFEDVLPDNTFYPYIESYWHAARGNCSDCPTTFRPYTDTTRGQLAKIIVLAACWPIYAPPQPTFDDVPTSNPFYQYIETAYELELVSGYTCGPTCLEFRPGANITRAQLSKIIVLAGVQADGWAIIIPDTPTFQDVPRFHTFYRYIETAYCHQIISGYNCGTGCLEFHPDNSATRGQIAKIVYEAILNHPCGT